MPARPSWERLGNLLPSVSIWPSWELPVFLPDCWNKCRPSAHARAEASTHTAPSNRPACGRLHMRESSLPELMKRHMLPSVLTLSALVWFKSAVCLKLKLIWIYVLMMHLGENQVCYLSLCFREICAGSILSGNVCNPAPTRHMRPLMTCL